MLRFSAMPGVPFRLGATPNPNAIRVGLGSALFAAPVTVRPGAEGAADALLSALVSIPGVVQVFAMSDFITVTKDGAAEWDALEPKIAEILLRHLDA